MKSMQDKCVDLIVTDPPYTLTKYGRSCRPNYMRNNMGDNLFLGDIPDANIWMAECYRILKDNTHFYTFCNINDLKNYLNIAEDVGFKLHNIITMIKDTHMPNRWYMKYCEFILFFRKGKAKPINDMSSKDYINVIMPKVNSGKLHITQKPFDLISKLITNSSSEGDVIFDPFMGSGTTGVAAVSTNRNFIGMETEDKYYQIAVDRIKSAIPSGDDECGTEEV